MEDQVPPLLSLLVTILILDSHPLNYGLAFLCYLEIKGSTLVLFQMRMEIYSTSILDYINKDSIVSKLT